MPRDGTLPASAPPIDWQAVAQIAMQQRDAAMKLANDREIDLHLVQARIQQLLQQFAETAKETVEPS